MSLLRSPNTRCASQPDLSVKSDGDIFADPQNSSRKRKQPDSENMEHEFAQFRMDMTSAFKDFCLSQTSNMNKLKDDILSQLKEQLTGLQLTSNRIVDEQIKIKSELQCLKQTTESDIQSLKESLNFYSEKHEETCKTIQEMTSDISRMNIIDQDVCLLRNKIDGLQFDLNYYQQRERITNLEITGIPQKTNEDLKDYIIKISKVAKTQLTQDDIIMINRVEPRSKIPGRPKVIVAKLATTLLRDSIISGIRKNRGLTTIDIGLPGDSRPIYVNEHLTPLNKSLYGKTREAAKKSGYRYVWVKNGKIFVRKDDTHPALNIKSTTDVEKIK